MAVTDLGRYRHLSTLGTGGMGRVDLAEDTRLGRRVALKRISNPQDARVVLRLRREALVGASLSHPNLVSIYDITASADGQPVIVMEHVDGENLRQTLVRVGRLGLNEACRIIDGVAAGLDAIHQRGIVHRDVKPSNILLGPEGVVKLADLGIAAVIDGTRLTTSGSVVGSASYMSPEQIEGRSVTPATDVYALATVAYEMLSGRRAWSGTNAVVLVHAISTQPPPELASVWPQAPAAAVELLRRAMDHDPTVRPPSAGELARALRAALLPAAAAREAAPARPPAAARPAALVPAGTAPARVAPRSPTRARRIELPQPTPARPSARRHGPRALAVGVLVAIIAAVAVVASLSGGGASPARRTGAAARAATGGSGKRAARKTAASHTARSGSTAGSAASGSTAAAAPAGSTTATAGSASAGSGGGSPVGAVESFYQLAAAGRYPAAWALADPTLRAQLGGYSGFQATVGDLRAITFDGARLVSDSGGAATVAVQTTADLQSGTRHCSGTVDLLDGGATSGWRLHMIHIACS